MDHSYPHRRVSQTNDKLSTCKFQSKTVPPSPPFDEKNNVQAFPAENVMFDPPRLALMCHDVQDRREVRLEARLTNIVSLSVHVVGLASNAKYEVYVCAKLCHI